MAVSQLQRASGRPHPVGHLSFALEPFASYYQEAVDEGLLRMHWAEVAPHKDIFWLNPNLAFYYQAAEKDILHIVTARSGGRLVGYVWMMLHPHLHYRHAKVAREDIHFLHPDYRKGFNAMHLFKATEDMMRELGAVLIVLGHKVNFDHGALFKRMGYSPLDITYSKRLDGENP